MWILSNFATRNSSHYKAVFEATSDCVFVIDGDLEIIEANEACARAFSWPASLFASMRLDSLISDILDASAASTANATAFLQESIHNGVRVIAKGMDGRKFRAELWSAPVTCERKDCQVVYLREVAWSRNDCKS